MPRTDDETFCFIRDHRVARLATADLNGQPAVIPICYVYDGEAIYSALDEKPKRAEPRKLRRVRNIEANEKVSLVIDDYSEDWADLAYVMIAGLALVIEPETPEHARVVALLREKYPQYTEMAINRYPIIKITPVRVTRWAARS
jgi:PPOX class probable F420-dependent enzyme